MIIVTVKKRHKSLKVKLPTYKAGHLKIIAQEGDCIHFLAPSLLAFIPVQRTGHTADFHKILGLYSTSIHKIQVSDTQIHYPFMLKQHYPHLSYRNRNKQ